MRSCAEVPEGFGSTEEFTQSDDAQAGLGARAADRSQRLERTALLQIGGATVCIRLTTEPPTQPQRNRRHNMVLLAVNL